jgi:tetratricopeptide (TPR) repeat protein
MMKKTRAIRLWVSAILLSGVALTVFSIQSGAETAGAQAAGAQAAGAETAGAQNSAASAPISSPATLEPQLLSQATPPATLASQSVSKSLLDKARTFEARGRMDMAVQTWQQVLLTAPNNPDALGGLARAAKLDGNNELANIYLQRLRAINPNDPNIARTENISAEQRQAAQLQQAGKLAEAGQYTAAMAIYRQVFGGNPPAGDWALAYYATESAIEAGRPHAIAGLQDLVKKYPDDARYQIALGRILTFNPSTRAEGRMYLERYPKDAQASEALRQSLLWDSANPAMAREQTPVRGSPVVRTQTPVRTQSTDRAAPGEAQAGAASDRARSEAEIAAYKALNSKHLVESELLFRAVLDKDPENPRALAGMGYIRMQQGNFMGAISFLEQAKQDNANDPGLENALDTARFWFTMGEGQTALNAGDLATAERQYRTALALRPDSPEALNGLGGTLQRAQQPAAAIPYFEHVVHANPDSAEGWRGLFLAQYEEGAASLALATEKRIPAAILAQLRSDPAFLRTLAAANSAVGRDSDAQKALESAVQLPYPADAKDAKADAQIQLAGTLLASNRLQQAATLYSQILAENHEDILAWQGLVRVQHAMGQDREALGTVESMSPSNYAAAMRDPGFEVTVASIYQAQKKLDVAQDLLEKAVAQQTEAGQRPSIGMQLQLAGLYVERGNPKLASPIYQQVLTEDASRSDAWIGLLSALHAAGQDKEAVEQAKLIPEQERAQIESNVNYLQTMGSVYSALGQTRQARLLFNRVQQYYAARHGEPPAEIDIQDAWLLYNALDDAGLYRQLMGLGDRMDLSEEQSRSVQAIWTNWAVRRANQAAAVGNTQRALAILNATARAFPDNPAVIKMLASGYARAGQPEQAVLIYKAQNMTSASAADYEAAVGAALAASDNKAAESWLKSALVAFPNDPRILILAAKFEQSRGDTKRAIDYYRASLKAMPPPDSGSDLAAALHLPAPTVASRLPSSEQPQNLSILLAPGSTDRSPVGGVPKAQAQPIPSSNGGGKDEEVPVSQAPSTPQGLSVSPAESMPIDGATLQVPPYMTLPEVSAELTGVQPDGSGMSQGKTDAPHLRGIHYATNLPSQTEVELRVREGIARAMGETQPATEVAELPAAETASQPARPPTPLDDQMQQVARLTEQAVTQPAAPVSATVQVAPKSQPVATRLSAPTAAQSQPSAPTSTAIHQLSLAPVADGSPPPSSAPISAPVQNAAANASIPSAVAVQLGDPTPHPVQPLMDATDVLPTEHYVANARANQILSSHPDIAAAQAAEIRRHQSDVDSARTGQSNPPPEDSITVAPENTQYIAAQQLEAQNQGAPLVVRPSAPPTGQANSIPDSGTQQYPQPSATPAPSVASPARSRVVRRTPTPAAVAQMLAPVPEVAATPSPAVPEPVLPAADRSLTNAPSSVQPLNDQPVARTEPLNPATSQSGGAEQGVSNLPPPQANYEPPAPVAMTPRQEAESGLATLEGSYSDWAGGSSIARYRSGTAGLDRLYDVEAPVETSVVIRQSVRLTAVALPVFLNSGTLNPAGFTSGYVPYLGTMPANSAVPPAQQIANGVGGELQLTSKNLGLAAGYTPYDFLIQNITGRFSLHLLGGHLTLFGDRAPVKDTQLSYAGLRDPQTITPTYVGKGWGGVVSSTGGARVDLGGGGSGFYLSADGGVLHGYHVLNNSKVEGAMGAYLRVKNWPTVGSLSVGGGVFAMHYRSDELGLTYGQGGYFSPNSFFLASVPVSFNDGYQSKLHYLLSGAFGVQTFQQDSALFYPLDPALQSSFVPASGVPCSASQIAAQTCGEYPVNGDTGFNYAVNSEVSYRFGEHWYLGGFVTANNANNYNAVSGGFYFRYALHRQHASQGYPTGNFPVDGFRPLQVP